MGTNSSKIILIGLDIADAELIDSWCSEGYLPNINLLREQGTWGKLGTTAEFMHLSAWPSLHTGTLPGRHGMYHAYQISPGEQEVHRTRADECAQPPFWKFLDEAGKKCIIMDAFLDYPLIDFNGIQIINWGTWTWFCDPQTKPAGLWKDIKKKFGSYPAPEHTKVLEIPDPEWLLQKLKKGASLKSKVVRWLMRKYPWDFFYVTFAETHPAGHYLWHYANPQNPADPGVGGEKYKNAMRAVYAAADSAIGEISAELDEDVTVLVTSVDGIGPNYAGCHLLPEMLVRSGLYKEIGDQRKNTKTGPRAKGSKKNIAKYIRDLVPYNIRRNISRFLPRHLQHQLSMKWVSTNVDWNGTKAFCIPNANEGYIRINLQGREPKGFIPSGSAYTEFCNELKGRCQDLVNPENGLGAVRQAVCSYELFDGPRISSLPDVIVTWDSDSKVLNKLYSEIIGMIGGSAAGYQTEPYYTGNHRPMAFFIARGPKIPESSVLDGKHIVDVAPTLLALMGIDACDYFDGEVIEELV